MQIAMRLGNLKILKPAPRVSVDCLPCFVSVGVLFRLVLLFVLVSPRRVQDMQGVHDVESLE